MGEDPREMYLKMVRNCLTLGLLLAATFVAVGCAVTQAGLEAREQNVLLRPHAVYETYDDLLLRVAQQVPAFGGMFFEFQKRSYTGVLYIYLLDPSQREAAAQAIMSVFGPLYPDLLPPREIQILPARYSFLQLKEWFDRISSLHHLPEVTMSDINDEKNHLTLGVIQLNSEVVMRIEEELTRLGIPREAVELIQTGPFVEDHLHLAQVLDTNRNGFLDDLEILHALDLWSRQVPVPSLGRVISDTQLLEVLRLWQSQQFLLSEE